MYRDPRIVGFTTNPTLMRKAGISDYAGFARDVLHAIRTVPCPSRYLRTNSAKWRRKRAS